MRTLYVIMLILLITTPLFAIPYASQIRCNPTSIHQGASLTISYFINEAGGTATIQIVEAANPGNVVATFSGTANLGTNSVLWDGTNNNAGGTPVAPGNYRVKITVNANNPAGWTEFASNRSVGNFGPLATYNTIFNGFSGKDLIITWNTDSDAFGLIIATSAYITPSHAAGIVFNADTSMNDGADGFASRVLKGLRDGLTTVGNQDVWGTAFDPDNPDAVFIAGQAGSGADPGLTGLYYGTPLTSSTLVDADPTDINSAALPRTVALLKEGTKKYAYFAQGNSIIFKVEVGSDNTLIGTGQNIMSLATTTRYSKDIEFDSSGNLYWASRRTTGETGGAVYRWNNSQILGLPPSPTLTEANAVWNVQAGSNMLSCLGVAITPSGDVYTAFAGGTERGIYYVGNVATPTLTKTLTTADRVVDFTTIGTGWTLSAFGANLKSDIAGNLYVVCTSTEQLRAFGPGGNTSVAIVAPVSQNITITTPPTGMDRWELYN